MVMLKNKNIKILTVIVTILMGAVFGLMADNEARAVDVSAICRRSKECMEAAENEEKANKEAADAASTANAYQNKVKETDSEIAEKERQIAESEAVVSELRMRIEKSEKEIVNDREALVDLLVNKHFESNAEPIKILAGASSISDLAEKAARAQVARQQINVQATKIKREKEELEANKTEVETRLADQQKAREELVAKKKEKEDLVAKYQNEAEQYEQVAAEERSKKQAAEQKWQDEHRNSFNGSVYLTKQSSSSSQPDPAAAAAAATNVFMYSNDDDTYPWKGDCPGKQDYYLTYINGYKVGGYVCECVSYVGWKAFEAYGLYIGWGNAYSWDDVARSKGYTVDHNPAMGTIGQVDGYPYGHVFWVEGVNSDGSINVTEYNNSYATYLYSGSSHYGDFGARRIPASEVGSYNYIHL